MTVTAEDALMWIRNKLGLQPDAQMFSGEKSIAGALHVVCAHADSYTRWSVERDAEVRAWREEKAALRSQLESYENREAACCPEDVGFEEYIKVLRGTIDSLAAISRAEALAPATDRRVWCAGCGTRWTSPEGFLLAGVVHLCGDCWRKVQPTVHAAALDTPLNAVAMALHAGVAYSYCRAGVHVFGRSVDGYCLCKLFQSSKENS